MTHSNLSRRNFMGVTAGTLACAGLAADAAPPKTEVSALSLRREVPVSRPYDVVVCGGGPSGVAAALAARRCGLEVLVIESQGQLGGNATSGLVSHWLGGRTSDCRRWVVGGLFKEFSEEAAKRDIALIPSPDPTKQYQPHGWYKGQLAAGIPLDPFRMATYLDEKMAEAGVPVLFFSQVVEPILEGGRITHVLVSNKNGLTAVPATVVIDATGDADVAARSGCDFILGRDEDGLMTPTSLTFHVDHVDQEALSGYIHKHTSPRFRDKVKKLRKAGEWPFPYDIFISVQLDQPGTMMINTTRLVGIDGTDTASLSEGMARGRQEIEQLMAAMRKHFPGFEKVRLKAVAPCLGVRETRRLRTEQMLTVKDLNQGRDFEDTIGYSAYGWDLPDPKRPSDNPGHGKKRPVTPIPYRIMVPGKIPNLICPGRAVSVERPVLGPLRVMAPCMAMGEAAGQAAAECVREGVSFGQVDTDRLRTQLAQQGAILEWA